jgi:hypothetical protein
VKTLNCQKLYPEIPIKRIKLNMISIIVLELLVSSVL